MSRGEGDCGQEPNTIKSYLRDRDWGRAGSRYANEQETRLEALTVIGRYL